MDEPVVAAEGHVYNRIDIERWLKQHSTSPLTSRWRHKLLILNMAIHRQINVWREEHGHPRSSSGNPAKRAKVYHGGGTAGAGAQIHKTAAVCGFSQRALPTYCVTSRKSICTNCAIDSSRCKSNTTRHLDAILSGIRGTHAAWVAWLEGRPEKLRPSHGCSRRCRADPGLRCIFFPSEQRRLI